ncbi:MAG: OprO/OprP family phosphate-selective porin [Gemmatimonadota bacterium]|nr:OprO/OprP family phosphate-selective porin [Gemmatimonadota bacterium]
MRRIGTAAAFAASLTAARVLPAQDSSQLPVVHAMLFGDVSYLETDRKIPSGFEMGQAVAHIIVSFNDRLNYFGEFTATAQPTGYAFEVERSILRYDFDDAVKISAGRYHTPIGYWNTAFHHGAWLQTTVSRPEMVKFGSQLIPTHFVGAFAEGNLPSGDLGLQYMAGVGNGRGSTISRAGDAGDVNGSRAWTASISARPAALFGAQLGVGYYRDRVTPLGGAAAAVEGISSAYFAWQRERPEFIAEFVHFDHTPTSGGPSAHDEAGYVQLAYRLPGAAHQFKPYARAEQTNIASNDVIFAPLALGYKGGIGGIRYDFNPFAALKAEYRRERFEGFNWSNGAYVQASFTVPDLGGGDHNAGQL